MGDSPAVVPISFLRIKAFNVTFVLIMTKPHLLLSLQVRRIVLGFGSLGGQKLDCSSPARTNLLL